MPRVGVDGQFCVWRKRGNRLGKAGDWPRRRSKSVPALRPLYGSNTAASPYGQNTPPNFKCQSGWNLRTCVARPFPTIDAARLPPNAGVLVPRLPHGSIMAFILHPWQLLLFHGLRASIMGARRDAIQISVLARQTLFRRPSDAGIALIRSIVGTCVPAVGSSNSRGSVKTAARRGSETVSKCDVRVFCERCAQFHAIHAGARRRLT